MHRTLFVLALSLSSLGALTVCALPAEEPAGDPPSAGKSCVSLAAGDHDRVLSVGGDEREYRLHVPPSGKGEARKPLVMVFHGGGQSGPRIEELIGMDSVADREGFLVAYPTGTKGLLGGHTWNGGDCCGPAMRQNVDDVGFTRRIIDTLVDEGCVDPDRVYATGISNGAIFTYRLGCELSDKIAAIAPIAGALMLKQCSPERAVPAIIFHGTADEDVKVKGGRNWQSGARRAFPPLEESIDRWLEINHCSPKARTHVSYDKGDSTCRDYDCASESGSVTFCSIQGGGHTWPGSEPFRPDRLGKTTQDLSANQEMWEFFEHHPMSGSSPSRDRDLPRRRGESKNE